jgi:hypothetical protein
MTEWQTEELWRKQLRANRNGLRFLQNNPRIATRKAIEEARRRIERIYAAGLPEWQTRDNPSRFP